jgi:hypothetical protein
VGHTRIVPLSFSLPRKGVCGTGEIVGWHRVRALAATSKDGLVKKWIEDALKRELERLRERGDLHLADEKALSKLSYRKLRRELEKQVA